MKKQTRPRKKPLPNKQSVEQARALFQLQTQAIEEKQAVARGVDLLRADAERNIRVIRQLEHRIAIIEGVISNEITLNFRPMTERLEHRIAMLEQGALNVKPSTFKVKLPTKVKNRG